MTRSNSIINLELAICSSVNLWFDFSNSEATRESSDNNSSYVLTSTISPLISLSVIANVPSS